VVTDEMLTGHADQRPVSGACAWVGLAGYLRDAVTVAEAADILWTCTSVEAYEILLLRG
jgi:hypothetical protein